MELLAAHPRPLLKGPGVSNNGPCSLLKAAGRLCRAPAPLPKGSRVEQWCKPKPLLKVPGGPNADGGWGVREPQCEGA